MLAAFLAAFFFALNATCATHNVRGMGAARANLGRLIVAALALGIVAHTVGGGFASASLGWFLLSGVIGMGLGDVGVYSALPLLGSRITVLMTQCLAAPLAALGEWLWLDTRLTFAQLGWGVVILGGVAFAITPSRSNPPRVRLKPLGFLFGFVAACGQGFGALVSRKGVNVAEVAGEAVHHAAFGVTAAYHRILAGLVIAVCWFALVRLLRPHSDRPLAPESSLRARYGWLVANGLAGPVAGVGCYQWALATTPSGIVLPIAATAPLLSIPIAWWLEGDRPTRRAVAGGVIAVAGCIALTAAR